MEKNFRVKLFHRYLLMRPAIGLFLPLYRIGLSTQREKSRLKKN